VLENPDSEEVQSQVSLYCILFVVVGVVTGLGMFLQVRCTLSYFDGKVMNYKDLKTKSTGKYLHLSGSKSVGNLGFCIMRKIYRSPGNIIVRTLRSI
jgi:hypothetical protein